MQRWPGDAQKELTTFGKLSRSDLMARVRSRGNKTTELRLIQLFRKEGIIGWRRHLSLPGRPDFAWPKGKVVIFVDGCYWHGHNCNRNLLPKTNALQWRRKIERTKERDLRNTKALEAKGWEVIRIWECELARRPNECVSRIAEAIQINKV